VARKGRVGMAEVFQVSGFGFSYDFFVIVRFGSAGQNLNFSFLHDVRGITMIRK